MAKAKLLPVKVVISNKEGANDPEGETIYRDLVAKSGFKRVRGIRSGKFLKVMVESDDPKEAARLVKKMCDELRIYNPAAHSVTVEA
ncbi:MAG: phosphoribosylformylglycinamidine synthase subunit PurS [Thaumarchaeota archaeon]|nr:phosphoribosylformylglycinamidine synthase subunit PurS [Nitrososphaerota archaeon]